LSWSGAGAVVVLHAGLLYALWHHRLDVQRGEFAPLFVSLLTPKPPPEEPAKPEPPKPVRLERPLPRPRTPQPPQQLVVEAPVSAPSEPVAPAPPPTPAVSQPEPVEATAPAAVVDPPKPAILPELAVTCPERMPPAYPVMARRLGEQGRAILRVELDESGAVVRAAVDKSSGFARLDDAALAAVRQWRCRPAQRNGIPVRAVALQPFNFVLQQE
jgi:protein TonB